MGVALVLALLEVRTFLGAQGHSLGPVMLLSYKNHALDEMLVDVLNHGGAPLRVGGRLIRCGKPESKHLERFREKSTPKEKTASQTLQHRLSAVRGAHRMRLKWCEAAMALETQADVASGPQVPQVPLLLISLLSVLTMF